MFNNKLVKSALFFIVFLQGFNLLLALGNTISNTNYQPSSWQYLTALLGSTIFGALLLIRLTNKKERVQLFFDPKTDKETQKQSSNL